MFKITAIVSLMLIATWSQVDSRRYKREASPSDSDPGSTLWAASLSCDSCGSECASACGTRHFRSCCFNYLRKKRGPESVKVLTHNPFELKQEDTQRQKVPFYVVEDLPESWSIVSNDFKLYPYEDTLENRLYYDM